MVLFVTLYPAKLNVADQVKQALDRLSTPGDSGSSWSVVYRRLVGLEGRETVVLTRRGAGVDTNDLQVLIECGGHVVEAGPGLFHILCERTRQYRRVVREVAVKGYSFRYGDFWVRYGSCTGAGEQLGMLVEVEYLPTTAVSQASHLITALLGVTLPTLSHMDPSTSISAALQQLRAKRGSQDSSSIDLRENVVAQYSALVGNVFGLDGQQSQSGRTGKTNPTSASPHTPGPPATTQTSPRFSQNQGHPANGLPSVRTGVNPIVNQQQSHMELQRIQEQRFADYRRSQQGAVPPTVPQTFQTMPPRNTSAQFHQQQPHANPQAFPPNRFPFGTSSISSPGNRGSAPGYQRQ